jgi:hypothetical protein
MCRTTELEFRVPRRPQAPSRPSSDTYHSLHQQVMVERRLSADDSDGTLSLIEGVECLKCAGSRGAMKGLTNTSDPESFANNRLNRPLTVVESPLILCPQGVKDRTIPIAQGRE